MGMSVAQSDHSQDDHHDRRKGLNPIPLNLREFINEDQRRTLKQIEGFGWQLAFVRRPLFQEPIVVIKNGDASSFGVVEEDGTINSSPDVIFRH